MSNPKPADRLSEEDAKALIKSIEDVEREEAVRSRQETTDQASKTEK